MNRKVLYISYDGMTDPLGQSQVLPYLTGLSKMGYQFTILSFEKKEKYNKLKDKIRDITTASGITWVPLRFTTYPPVISKFYDAIRMKRMAYKLYRRHRFDMIHCRSYVAAEAGLSLKKKWGVKFFFDMRGFWADEKKDAGAWDQKKFIFRKIYQHYKRKETEFINHADYIISLTHAGKSEIMTWPAYLGKVPISVIPCCSDMKLFTLTTPEEKQKARALLGLPEDKLVISYLGSVGSWYMLDEMLELFARILETYPGAKFLFITPSPPQQILEKLDKYGLAASDLVIQEATRLEVPVFMKASDINVSFIKPLYSKKSSSPTKLGEVLAMGIPVISNSGVGDVEEILNETNAGFIIHQFEKQEFLNATASIRYLLKKSPGAIRKPAEKIFSLDKGIAEYYRCYEELFSAALKKINPVN
jgi:glycosyltransferase involved in cell wall biosynthesis